MATSSITKEFRVTDKKAYDRLLKDIKRNKPRAVATESSAVKKGREKLATFVFR